MTRHRGRLLAVEANHGLLVDIETSVGGPGRTHGQDVSLVADLFALFGDNTYSLVRINDDGTHTVVLSGLASPGSLTRGPDGALYLTQCSFHCAPGTRWISCVVVE